MADPRKVPFITLASYNTTGNTTSASATTATATTSTPGPECKKRRREDEAEVGGLVSGPCPSPAPAPAAAGAAVGFLSNGKSAGTENSGATGENKPTVRLTLTLSEPSDKSSSEFNYTELIQSFHKVRKPPDVLTPVLDPTDPLADQDRERQEVEALARKFESKYGGTGKKKKRDRMQDLIDIGYGYDETDPFIDNSEAYDELVPASLTTKLGGFYINTGTLQFRAASESEDEDKNKDGNHFKKLKDGEDRVIKRRKKKQDGILDEKKPRKNKVPKPGVSALNRPEKKKRKKLMKDSLSLAAMIRRFQREKDEMRKKNPPAAVAASLKPPAANRALNSHSVAPVNDLADLTNDPGVLPLLGAENEDLQALLSELDSVFMNIPDTVSQEGQSEDGSPVVQRGGLLAGRVQRASLIPPPPLPDGLPAPLAKRIEDLRVASRQFDMEGRKKFFTLDMNNILQDIELQVQEQPAEVRSAVYSHLEAFVPCNKEALLKRLKKLSLNVQDDRLKNPLLKLKLAVCSAMPEQIARYNMDCLAKVAKQQSEDGEKNGSEEEDDERPGKRVMGPRKKFVWDDKLRNLLCNLVRAKLGCYEVEGQTSPSPEDYLKAFMETEVKPLWPKGWMQARMLIKESRMAHSHLTGNMVKKRMVPTPKAKPKPQDGAWLQQSPMSTSTPTATPGSLPQRLPSPSEPICLSDSLDEDLGGAPSLDSISQALALLSSAAKGLIQSDGPSSPEGPKPVSSASMVGPAPPVSSSSPQISKKNNLTSATSSPIIVSSSSSLSSPSISRPMLVSVSPSVRNEALMVVKPGTVGMSPTQRHTMTTPQRPVSTTVTGNINKSSATSSPKPRPPPTSSPLHPPHKNFSPSLVTPTGLHKPSNNNIGRIGGVATTQSAQPHSTNLSIASSSYSPSSSSPSTPSSSHLNAKPQPRNTPSPALLKPQPRNTPSPALLKPQPRNTPSLALLKPQPRNTPSPALLKPQPRNTPSPALLKPQPKNTPSPALLKPQPPQHHPQPQSTFVTPMQATLTKSPHSSNSPILKLTPRVTPSSSPLPTISRTPTLPSMHQYSPKGPGFHAGFSGVAAGYNASVAQQKNSSQVNNAGLASTSTPVSKHSMPAASSANHGQRQRPAGGANQGVKPMVSISSVTASQLSQVSSSSPLLASGAANLPLLASGAANLPLSFGMLGGITPVSLPFPFPSLINLPTVTGTNAGASNANQSGSGYTLQPNVSQSQSGDLKRKL
ncbi:ubinuclein-2b [Trichomycterus rosablanca]|uniref:ubinuclein-2b n=1 Tax=Trichomycterus rosablanca TaxID=2290929 RepID=UPI002F35AA29